MLDKIFSIGIDRNFVPNAIAWDVRSKTKCACANSRQLTDILEKLPEILEKQDRILQVKQKRQSAADEWHELSRTLDALCFWLFAVLFAMIVFGTMAVIPLTNR